jgi:hypothetical protein
MSAVDGMAGMGKMTAGASASSDMLAMGHHGAAIVGLLFLPILIFTLVLAMQAGSLAGVGLARRFEAGYRNAVTAAHMAALALAMTAAIHLSLVPGHFAEDRVLGTLFALAGIAFGGAAMAVYLGSAWRTPALLLVATSLLAYAFYILNGREDVDAVGIFTKLVELSAALVILFDTRSNQLIGRLAPAIAREASL